MAEIALRQIKAILAVCEEGSFTRAADRENATQSGISQHVAATERALGVKLFERSAAGANFFKVDLAPFPIFKRVVDNCMANEAFARAHPLKQPGAPASV